MRHTRAHWLMYPLLLALTACAGGDKYPFPPQFVSTSDISPRVLAAPPEKFSAQYNREIDGILAHQATLTATDKATLMAEDHITPSMIVDPVLGKKYTAESNPALFTLLRHSASDAWRIADTTQDYWHRDRPWVADARVQLLVGPIKRPSYPSGHSTTNHVWAHVLSELFPNKKDALFTRAYEIGMHRSAGGVHYPSDIEAGKKIAASIYEKMRATPQFKMELAAARAELKHAPGKTRVTAQKPDSADTPLPRGKVPAHCTTPKPGASMTMCP